MGETTAYLSPNGGNDSTGDGPALRLVVATVEGVATFRRESQDAPWRLSDRSLADRHVGSLVFEPGSGKLFAGAHSDGGLWISDDGEGAAWRPLTNGLDRPHIYGLAGRRIGERVTLFAGTQPAALYRSDDLGETWTEARSLREVPGTDKWTFPPPPHLAHVKSVVFHPARDETIYALVEQGALLRSDDDGRTWTELAGYAKPDDFTYRDVHRLVISKTNPSLFYLATGEGLYRSDDGGQIWEHLIPRAGRIGYPDFLFFDPHDDRTLFLGGAHNDPGKWFANPVAESIIARSTDGGRTWLELDHGLPSPMVPAFEAICVHHWGDGATGGMMIAIGTATGEIYVSEDDGASWTCIADNAAPISKDHHHLAWLPSEERERAMAARHA